MSDYDMFVQEHGWKFGSEEAMKAAYERACKSVQGILISEYEFLTEAKKQDNETAKATYATLANLFSMGKLTAADVYQYAHFKWCLEKPTAIIVYKTENGKWVVNNCDSEIGADTAKIKVCEEFGFKASRIQIIGTPYYDATDWNFIRFDCCGWYWLMRNGSIYPVYQ